MPDGLINVPGRRSKAYVNMCKSELISSSPAGRYLAEGPRARHALLIGDPTNAREAYSSEFD